MHTTKKGITIINRMLRVDRREEERERALSVRKRLSPKEIREWWEEAIGALSLKELYGGKELYGAFEKGGGFWKSVIRGGATLHRAKECREPLGKYPWDIHTRPLLDRALQVYKDHPIAPDVPLWGGTERGAMSAMVPYKVCEECTGHRGEEEEDA